MTISLRCRVCREEFVVCESIDDDPVCVRCYIGVVKPYEAEIARLRADNQALSAENVRWKAEVERLIVERDGANERARLVLNAKNEWADRAKKAEAVIADLKARLAKHGESV